MARSRSDAGNTEKKNGSLVRGGNNFEFNVPPYVEPVQRSENMVRKIKIRICIIASETCQQTAQRA